jgi:hypothetical protein
MIKLVGVIRKIIGGMFMLHSHIYSFYDQLKSSPFVQGFLQDCYRQKNVKDGERLSFENTERFIYYLEHAENFFQQSKKAPLSIKPVLLFYGLNQLIKACLIMMRPAYPENSKLLAHGVSSRKRKKQSYSFLQDEVKIQQYGLFPYFSNHLFRINQFPSDKFSMVSLFNRIPELNFLYHFQNKDSGLIKVGQLENNQLYVPIEKLQLAEKRMLENFILKHNGIREKNKEQNMYIFSFNKPILPYENHLFYIHLDTGEIFIYTKKYIALHEVMVHYLILYNLSMICRYETEWWVELLHTFSSNDFAFINSFLKIAERKIPIMLGYFLFHAWNKNKNG